MQRPLREAANVTARKPNSLRSSFDVRYAARRNARGLTRAAFVRFVAGLAFITFAAFSCRQNEPLEPKTPPNSPLPKIDRPDDPPAAPTPKLPKPDQDGGAGE